MIDLVKNKHINRDKWDTCIKNSINYRIYGHSWYLDQVCENWDALIYGDYVAVFPLPYKSKFGVKYVYTPYFVQQLGLFCTSEAEFHLVDSFLHIIKKSYALVDIYLQNETFPARHGISIRKNYELSLSESHLSIATGYSNNLRRNIKVAMKNKLHVAPHTSLEEIVSLFRAGRGATIRNWKGSDYSRFIRLIKAMQYKGQISTWGAYSDANNLLAGVVLLHDHKYITMIFSGVSDEGRELRGMPYLLNSIIERHSGSNLTFDFEGSMDPGLARFYSSFGSTRRDYWFFRSAKWPLSLFKPIT